MDIAGGEGFFGRDVQEVATDLLGCSVQTGQVAVRITEVEAYGGADDPGSHAFRGETPRTAVMFGPPGRWYVYFSYGMHWCANVVCGPPGEAAAVLLRAGEVVRGQEVAAARRALVLSGSGRGARELARGPARLARCLGANGQLDGTAAFGPDATAWVGAAEHPVSAQRIRSGPRVGVRPPGGDAGNYPWRYWIDAEPTVSPYRPWKPRVRR
ncbi:DNA-3-methyladenine glycosylase [Dermacoccaceae bacterium W4C1]